MVVLACGRVAVEMLAASTHRHGVVLEVEPTEVTKMKEQLLQIHVWEENERQNFERSWTENAVSGPSLVEIAGR